MPSEMVELVARAIDPDAFEACSHGRSGFCLMCAEDRDFAIYRARAAIEALREPTEAMSDGGSVVTPHHLFNEGGAVITDENAREVWQAMIDEALK